MTEQSSRNQVLIVGGGPVGIGLALTLGLRGVSCRVLERHTELHRVPKGQNLTQRTAELFHFWGIEKELRAGRTMSSDRGIGGLVAHKTLLGPYHHDWLQRDLVGPFYFCANERLPQYATESIMRTRAAEVPAISINYGYKAVQVGQTSSSAWVEAEGTDGILTRFSADYVVGCEGSKSLVRKRAGIGQSKVDHNRLMVLLVFRSKGLNSLLERFPNKSFYNVLHPDLGGYWQFFGRVDDQDTFFFHAPVPSGTTRENLDFAGLLQDSVGGTFEVELQHVGFWDLRFALADSYRKGRLFIAGDAAHSHPPYGGYGINSGLEDAVNLAWKLAAVLQGWGADHLLDSYDLERRPVFASTARDFIARSIEVDRKFLAEFDPASDRAGFEAAWRDRSSQAQAEVFAFEPSYEGSPIVWNNGQGKPTALGQHLVAARAGHHLTPLRLSGDENVFERLGPGFTLLSFGGDAASLAAFEAEAKRLGIPLVVIPEPARSKAAVAYAATFVLVRPDQFIAWAGHDPLPPAEIILQNAVGH